MCQFARANYSLLYDKHKAFQTLYPKLFCLLQALIKAGYFLVSKKRACFFIYLYSQRQTAVFSETDCKGKPFFYSTKTFQKIFKKKLKCFEKRILMKSEKKDTLNTIQIRKQNKPI